MNYDQLTKHLWLGSGPVDANDVQDLINHGITAIIDVRQLDDNTLVLGAERSEVTVLYNPTLDDGSPKPVEWFKRSYDFALAQLGKGGVLYAHCDAGINRGPSTAYFILRACYGIFPEDAKHIIHTHRPITLVGIRYADDADSAITTLGL